MSNKNISMQMTGSYEIANSVVEVNPEPLVTVIGITYQHKPYIAESIKSIIQQKTSFAFEYIIGEDFSTDGTREIVFDYAKQYPHIIRVITADKNVGVHANAERCINSARGKYIALCEGDDYWHDQYKIQRQVDLIESDPSISMVCSDVDALDQKTGRLVPSVDKRLGSWIRSFPDMTKSLLLRKVTPFTCTTLMRREDLNKVRSENAYEFSSQWPLGDLQLFIELSRLGRIVHIDESMATYRSLPVSASRFTSVQSEFSFTEKVEQLSIHYVRKLGYKSDTLNEIKALYFRQKCYTCFKYRSLEARSLILSKQHTKTIRPTCFLDKYFLATLKCYPLFFAGTLATPLLLLYFKASQRIKRLIGSS